MERKSYRNYYICKCSQLLCELKYDLDFHSLLWRNIYLTFDSQPSQLSVTMVTRIYNSWSGKVCLAFGTIKLSYNIYRNYIRLHVVSSLARFIPKYGFMKYMTKQFYMERCPFIDDHYIQDEYLDICLLQQLKYILPKVVYLM